MVTKVQPQHAKPGKKEKVEKAAKAPRVPYPGLKDEAGNDVKLASADIPADFNPRQHLPLQRKHFASEDLYFTVRANHARKQAAFFDAKAEEAKKVGNVADKARARRLIKMQEKMAELRKQLEAQNIDVDELLAKVAPAPKTAE